MPQRTDPATCKRQVSVPAGAVIQRQMFHVLSARRRSDVDGWRRKVCPGSLSMLVQEDADRTSCQDSERESLQTGHAGMLARVGRHGELATLLHCNIAVQWRWGFGLPAISVNQRVLIFRLMFCSQEPLCEIRRPCAYLFLSTSAR